MEGSDGGESGGSNIVFDDGMKITQIENSGGAPLSHQFATTLNGMISGGVKGV
ncbi:conserved hypothetical protein [Ricinus communis]|uniref:Uncharacterized protein n=1 Tax=Ricinus communis TaxID=3988 RepID=B9RQG4_RICCO|nr:conserved hypothetical protein [Ricinus communis]